MREARGGVLVVGGGFAGTALAAALGRAGATLISPENSMLYTPMLPEAASGTLEPRHVVVPVRMMCPHAELLLGSATAIDLAARTVRVRLIDGRELEVHGDRLVLALGGIPSMLPIPGLAEQGLPFRTLADAVRLRDHVLQRLELAAATPERARRELTFVFVGAGYAGVEALAELSDLLRDARRHYPTLAGVPDRWLLVDAAPKVLPDIPHRLGSYAATALARRGVEIKVGTRLVSAVDGRVELSDGTVAESETLVWTAGMRANPLVDGLGVALGSRGRIRVDDHFAVPGFPGVFALGDCAEVPNGATPDRPDPPTCQHALRQARRLAANLRGKPAPYRYRMLGQVATLGRHQGIAEVLGFHLSGFPGWWFTRTYHLAQLPLAGRKMRVVADWTVALLFRRDIAELGFVGRPRRPPDP